MSDMVHKEVDKMISDIEKELKKSYTLAYKTLKDRLADIHYRISRSSDQEEIQRLIKHDKWINEWINELAIEINSVNKQAVQIVNDNLLDNYALNHEYGIYLMESGGGVSTGITVFNRATLKELVKGKLTPFTLMAYDGLKDRKSIIRDLTREITQSLILGESNQKLATRIKNVADKNYKQAITIARTEMTRIESVGRQDAFKEGEKLGLKLKKRWVSTYDSRTRDSHRRLNHEVVDLDEPFSNGLQYPGGLGSAKEVINCRCSHIVEFVGMKRSEADIKLDEELKSMTYTDWRKQKNADKR